MPEKTWTVGSQVSLYRYLFSKEFEKNVKIEAVSAIVRRSTGNAKVYFELEHNEDALPFATTLQDAISYCYLEAEDLGVPKAVNVGGFLDYPVRCYTVILDEENLELAKKLVIDYMSSDMSKIIDKFSKDVKRISSGMHDVSTAEV